MEAVDAAEEAAEEQEAMMAVVLIGSALKDLE